MYMGNQFSQVIASFPNTQCNKRHLKSGTRLPWWRSLKLFLELDFQEVAAFWMWDRVEGREVKGFGFVTGRMELLCAEIGKQDEEKGVVLSISLRHMLGICVT